MEALAKIKLKLKEKKEVYFDVKVKPSAAQSRLVEEMADETLKIALTAPAEKGAANEELIKFLARELAVPKSSIQILSGKTDRKKLIKIKF